VSDWTDVARRLVVGRATSNTSPYADESLASAAHGLLGGFLSRGGALAGSQTRAQGELLRLYGTTPIIRMVSYKIAETIASCQWSLHAMRGSQQRARAAHYAAQQRYWRLRSATKLRAAGELEEVEAHPFLDGVRLGTPLLLGHLNLQVSQICYDVSGEYFWVLDRNAAGVPHRWWVVPPHWVSETPTLQTPFFRILVHGVNIEIPIEDMVWVRDPDPWSPYRRGTGAARSLAEELDADRFAGSFTSQFFANNAVPNLLIMGPKLNETTRGQMSRRWLDRLQGLYKKWLPYFMEAPHGAQVKELSQDFQAMNLVELRNRHKSLAMEVFGLNPEILGHVVGSNRATSTMAQQNFRAHVVIPRLELIRAVFQYRILPLYNSPRPLVAEYTLPELQDPELELDYFKAAPWAQSISEIRRRQGADPAEDLPDDVHAIPLAVRWKSRAELLNPPAPPAPPLPASDEGGDEGADDAEEEAEPAESKAASHRSGSAARWWPWRRRATGEAEFWEAFMALAESLEGEARDVFLQAAAALKDPWTVDDLEDLIRDIGDADLAADRVAAALGDDRAMIGLEAGSDTVETLIVEAAALARDNLITDFGLGAVDMEAFSARAANAAASVVGEEITNVSKKTIEAVRDRIVAGYEEGRKTREIAETVKEVLGLDKPRAEQLDKFIRGLNNRPPHLPDLTQAEINAKIQREYARLLDQRAWTVARTENLRAATTGQNELWREAASQGIMDPTEYRRRWVRVPAATDCPICESYEGQEVGISVLFDGIEGKLDGSPAHANCLCAIQLIRLGD
jgi:hypothetical protein